MRVFGTHGEDFLKNDANDSKLFTTTGIFEFFFPQKYFENVVNNIRFCSHMHNI